MLAACVRHVEVARLGVSVVTQVCPGSRLAALGGCSRGLLTGALVLGEIAGIPLVIQDTSPSGTWALGRIAWASVSVQAIRAVCPDHADTSRVGGPFSR